MCALAMLCAACPQSSEPESTSSSTETAFAQIDPTRIDRARGQLPPGYEVATYTGAPEPVRIWSFGDGAVSEPTQCLALAAPAVDSATMRGWSASGPGGIVYAVVAMSHHAERPDADLLAECAQWTLRSGHTSGAVTVQPGPVIDAAQTVAMSIDVTTVVEGGTETRTSADTFVAYLASALCFVSLVTDPGASSPTLTEGFAADLLDTVVSALRG